MNTADHDFETVTNCKIYNDIEVRAETHEASKQREYTGHIHVPMVTNAPSFLGFAPGFSDGYRH